MDQSYFSGSPDFVLSTLKTTSPATNAGKLVEFFLPNPAQPLHFVSSTSSFVLPSLEQKTYCRNLAATATSFDRACVSVCLDVAGRYLWARIPILVMLQISW